MLFEALFDSRLNDIVNVTGIGSERGVGNLQRRGEFQSGQDRLIRSGISVNVLHVTARSSWSGFDSTKPFEGFSSPFNYQRGRFQLKEIANLKCKLLAPTFPVFLFLSPPPFFFNYSCPPLHIIWWSGINLLLFTKRSPAVFLKKLRILVLIPVTFILTFFRKPVAAIPLWYTCGGGGLFNGPIFYSFSNTLRVYVFLFYCMFCFSLYNRFGWKYLLFNNHHILTVQLTIVPNRHDYTIWPQLDLIVPISGDVTPSRLTIQISNMSMSRHFYEQ